MIRADINGIELCLKTTEGLFSPGRVDRGTLAMLSVVVFEPGDKVLDLGCGYGAVGLYAASCLGPENVVMTDADGDAVALARENAALNHLSGVRVVMGDAYDGVSDRDFTVILSNPPYHTDFSVAKRFIEKGFNRLAIGGRMYMVTKRRKWYENKLTAVFGGVRIREIDGYFVFMSIKRGMRFAGGRSK